MALLRVIHASELPDPAALIDRLASGEGAPARAPSGSGALAPAAPAASSAAPESFTALVDLLATGGKPHLAQQLHDYCGLVRYSPPELVVKPAKPLSGDFARELAAVLKTLTGQTWQVSASDGPAEPSLLEQERMAADNLRQNVLESPMVKAAFEAFPGAELAGFSLDEQRSA
jgi:DNA polymerase-3 subunit gamma/tau